MLKASAQHAAVASVLAVSSGGLATVGVAAALAPHPFVALLGLVLLSGAASAAVALGFWVFRLRKTAVAVLMGCALLHFASGIFGFAPQPILVSYVLASIGTVTALGAGQTA